MTREIKFRGKDIKTGEWLYVDLRNKESVTEAFIATIHRCNVKINPITVGQFTGLLDKNGKEIYEGDIIFSQKCDCRAILHKIEYNVDNAMFVAKPIQGWDFDFCQIRKDWIDKYGKEVIGNIYDNLELLKTETL